MKLVIESVILAPSDVSTCIHALTCWILVLPELYYSRLSWQGGTPFIYLATPAFALSRLTCPTVNILYSWCWVDPWIRVEPPVYKCYMYTSIQCIPVLYVYQYTMYTSAIYVYQCYILSFECYVKISKYSAVYLNC